MNVDITKSQSRLRYLMYMVYVRAARYMHSVLLDTAIGYVSPLGWAIHVYILEIDTFKKRTPG